MTPPDSLEWLPPSEEPRQAQVLVQQTATGRSPDN
jgi:hypothetical protein